MEWLVFIKDYGVALLNTAFLVAGALLTLNEISGRFLGHSVEWPREHRLKAIVALLIVAQVWAYKTNQDESSSRIGARDTEIKLLKEELQASSGLRQKSDELLQQRNQMNTELAELRSELRTVTTALTSTQSQLIASQAQLATSQSQINDLQQQISRMKQAPTVVLGSGTAISREACDTLGLLVAEGQALLAETRKEQTPHPGPKGDAWAAKTEAFLRKTFGEGSVGLFRNASGLPLGLTSLQSQVHRNLEGNESVGNFVCGA